MPSRSDTPTPGDLSARLPDETPLMGLHKVIERRGGQLSPLDIDRLRRAIAALSALPAGGDVPEDWVRFGFHGERVACRPAIAERVQNALLREVMTGIEQREATTPPADADVGAQGDGKRYTQADLNAEYTRGRCDGFDAAAPAAGKGVDADEETRLLAAFVLAHDDEEAWLERTGHLYDPHLPTRAGIRAVQAALTAPAAGKGVDDDVREYLTEQLATEGAFEGLGYSKVERNLRALRKLDALTRQPVAGDKK